MNVKVMSSITPENEEGEQTGRGHFCVLLRASVQQVQMFSEFKLYLLLFLTKILRINYLWPMDDPQNPQQLE